LAVDDLGVRHGWSLIHDLPTTITPRALEAEGNRFRPRRSTVALYCWHAVHVARGQVPVPDAEREQARAGADPAGGDRA
jgi:DNA-3-methyladenine glycosylase II